MDGQELSGGSLRVGPQAFVLAYGDKDFKGDVIRLGPSEEVPDLARVKFDDKIDSIRIVDSIEVFDCTSSAKNATSTPIEVDSDTDEKDSIGDHSEARGPGLSQRHKRRRH